MTATPQVIAMQWTAREAAYAWRMVAQTPDDAPIRARMAEMLGRPPTAKELAIIYAVEYRSPLGRRAAPDAGEGV